MVAQAKSGGGVHLMYPGGSWLNASWFLAEAVSHAMRVLGYLEMPKDDRPPPEIWLLEDDLQAHFEQLERKYSGSRADTESVPMAQNELTRGLRG